LLADVAEADDGLGVVAGALDVEDDSLTEDLVGHVVADLQPERLGAARTEHRRGTRTACALVAAARPHRGVDDVFAVRGAAAPLTFLPHRVHELLRDLLEESARLV